MVWGEHDTSPPSPAGAIASSRRCRGRAAPATLDAHLSNPATHFPHANLPNRLGRMVGRDEDVAALSAHLTASHFVTIVGAGGVGKTTVAVAVAHRLSEAFGGATLFVDLGMLNDPGLVTTAIASMLGLPVGSPDARPNLMAWLRDKRILLILDTCEHLIDEVAALAGGHSRLRPAGPHPGHEPRGPPGRGRARLQAGRVLACPPDDEGASTAAAVQTFPAMQLFVATCWKR